MEDAKYVDVAGIKTRYFEGGTGATLVLIHGGQFGSYYAADHWSLLFAELCKDFHVYAFDKLGQGFTDNPKSDDEYTMTAVMAHADAFVRTLGLENITLLGHSRGALPAAHIAMDHPSLTKALIILSSNTLAPDSPATDPFFYNRLELNPPPVPDREFVCREPLANSYSRTHMTDDFARAMLEIALLPKTSECRKKMATLIDTLFLPSVQTRKYECLDRIRSGGLKTPTLIAWGFHDPSAPVQLGMDLLRLIAPIVAPTRFYVFNRAGHYVFREHPQELHRTISAFVQNL